MLFESNEIINRAGFRARKMEREKETPRKTRFILGATALTTQKLNVCVLGDKTGVIVRVPPIFDGGYSVRSRKYGPANTPSRKYRKYRKAFPRKVRRTADPSAAHRLARRAKELFVSFALLHAKENNGRGSAPSCSTHVVPRLRRCKHGAPVQGGRGVQKPQLHA